MPNNWKKYKLTDLGTLARGKSKNRPRDAAFLYGGPYPFIQTGDIKGSNHRIYSYTQTYSEAGLQQSKLWPKDTICLTIAANIGDTAILNFPACFPDSVLGFIADKTKCDVEFIEYLLQHYKKEIQSHSIGSVQDNINLGTFENVEFNLPSLPEQQAIAEILSSLDDKIELNLQTNKTLEEMANTLYKHWFVDFGPFLPSGRCPQDGRGPIPGFIESELGLIPEGWEVANLKSLLVDFNNKRGPISSMEREKIKGNYPYYGATGILDYVNKFGFDGRYILIAEDGTVKNNTNNPYLQYIEGKFWVSNHAHIIRGNADYPDSFIYYTLSNTIVLPYITGAVQPKLSKGSLESIVILKPTSDAAFKYSKIVDEYVDLIFQKNYEIENLKQTRDYLLPKLISGEIRVKDAAKKLKEVL